MDVMKKFIVLIMVIAMISPIYPEIMVFCDKRDVYEIIKNEDSTYEFLLMYSEAEYSRYIINNDISMFTHMIPSMQSAYYSISPSSFDTVTAILTMDVISDAGNKYQYIFNMKEKTVKIVYLSKGILYMTIFRIKNIISNEK